MAEIKKRLLTGLQPSGNLHIGNYFVALKPFIERQGEFQSFLMIVDYHAPTSLKNPKELKENIWNVALDYLGAGLDPKQAILFRQSEVPQHTELAWIFECLVTVPFLMQAHAYKDKVAKGMEANAGLFNYPMLMAADILLYDTDFVPVGKDQQQHIEYAREAATKFNLAFGQTFKDPQGVFIEGVAVVPGTDGQKMSKSYKNTIPLFGSKDEIQKAVMSIVTDSSGERPENVYAIHALVKTEAELAPLYEQAQGKYKNLKEALVEDLDVFIAPMRARREEYAQQPDTVHRILREGSERARELAEAKMTDVRQKIGVAL
jgi:tryptophanyl-tRNA synthetase